MNERYFGLQDESGRFVRIGVAENSNQASQFEQAGFIEIAKELFDRLKEFVEQVPFLELGALILALDFLRQLRTPRPLRMALSQLPINRRGLFLQQVAFKERMNNLAVALSRGDITLDEWSSTMQEEIRQHTLQGRVLAVGKKNLDANDLLEVQRDTEEQLMYFENWRSELAVDYGKEDFEGFDAKALARRGRLYANANRKGFEISITQKIGLPRLPVYPTQRSDCGSLCGCHWAIFPIEPRLGHYDCYWGLGDAASCDQCDTRYNVWNPLKVRYGKIMPYYNTPLLYSDGWAISDDNSILFGPNSGA